MPYHIHFHSFIHSFIHSFVKNVHSQILNQARRTYRPLLGRTSSSFVAFDFFPISKPWGGGNTQHHTRTTSSHDYDYDLSLHSLQSLLRLAQTDTYINIYLAQIQLHFQCQVKVKDI